jgi:hypothetical protein
MSRLRMRSLRSCVGASLAALVFAVTGSACSGGGSGRPAADASTGVSLTVWTRAGTQSQTQALIDAYNALHRTKGGPDDSTTSVVMVIVREAFVRFDLGSAAALSVLALVVLLILNILQLSILRRRSDS